MTRDDARAAIHAAITGYADDEEVENLVAGQVDALAEAGAEQTVGIEALPKVPYGTPGDAQSILDDLVQDCADMGSDPDEGSRINNEGYAAQVAYLLAYNGQSGIGVVRQAFNGLLDEPTAPAPSVT
jgi:hypothetical protein